MPPNHFESEVESFLEGSHGDRTHTKRADHPRLHHYAGRYFGFSQLEVGGGSRCLGPSMVFAYSRGAGRSCQGPVVKPWRGRPPCTRVPVRPGQLVTNVVQTTTDSCASASHCYKRRPNGRHFGVLVQYAARMDDVCNNGPSSRVSRASIGRRLSHTSRKNPSKNTAFACPPRGGYNPQRAIAGHPLSACDSSIEKPLTGPTG